MCGGGASVMRVIFYFMIWVMDTQSCSPYENSLSHTISICVHFCKSIPLQSWSIEYRTFPAPLGPWPSVLWSTAISSVQRAINKVSHWSNVCACSRSLSTSGDNITILALQVILASAGFSRMLTKSCPLSKLALSLFFLISNYHYLNEFTTLPLSSLLISWHCFLCFHKTEAP